MLKSSCTTSRPRPTKLRKCISSSKADNNSDDDNASNSSSTAVRQVQFRIMHPDQRQQQQQPAMGGAQQRQQQQQPPGVVSGGGIVGNRCCSLKRSAPGKSPDLTTYATGQLLNASSPHRPELAYAKLQQQPPATPAAALAPASSAVSSCCSSMTASASSTTIPTSTTTMALKKSSSAATLCSPSKEWAALLADSNSSDEDDEDDRTASSTLSSGASDVDSSMEEDSDDNDNEDEEETRMAKMLVNAAFSRTMSSTQLANILCQPSPRKKQRMNPNMQELLERQPSLQSLQPNSSKQPPSPSLVRMIQSAPSLVAAAATSQQRQQQALLAQQRQAGGAAGVVAGGMMPPHLQEQLVQHQQRQWTIGPQDFLRALLKKRGYPHDTMVPASKLENFFVPITAESVASYDMQTVKAVRAEDVDTLRRLNKERGHGRLQCGNKFGESIVHTAARRGSAAVLRFLFEEAGVCAAVCCDAGRTPLHDACWSAQPNFEAVAILLEYGRDLLYIQDARGFTPLQYVPRDQWKSWCKFLHERPAAAQLAPTPELLQQATTISAEAAAAAAAAEAAPGPAAASLAAGAAVAVSG